MESREESPALSVRAARRLDVERMVARRARGVVARLVRVPGRGEPGDAVLSSSVGAVLLASAAVLREGLINGQGAGFREVLKRAGDRKGGERLWGALADSLEEVPFLEEGLLSLGAGRIESSGPCQEMVSPLASLLELVLDVLKTRGEWSALRLPGAIYEASLGWELSGNALSKESQRIKAAGAVYTPRPVVRFIVERTLGPLVSSAAYFDGLSALTVCDPACGAGAFLLEAMRFLEEEALKRRWLNEDREERLDWRRRLTVGCLNGVDLDPSAVQLARLTLWLASGCGEAEGRALGRSVRQGDALVGAWKGDLHRSGGGEDELSKLRRAMDEWCGEFLPEGAEVPALHWELDFPERFPPAGCGQRGWSAVVGNPPYVKARELRHLGPYLKARFPASYTGHNDLSAFFFHRGLEILKPEGRLGFIAPAYWFQNTYGEKLRRFLLSRGRLEEVYDFGPAQVFPGRNVHTALVIMSKKLEEGTGGDGHRVRYQRLSPGELGGSHAEKTERAVRVPQRSLEPEKWVFASAEADLILQKVFRRGHPLGELFYIEKGPTSGQNGIFVLHDEELENQNIEPELLRPCIKNSEVLRYGPLAPKRWLIYLDGSAGLEGYPKAAAYLKAHRRTLASRNEARRGLYPWWRLERPRRRALFEAPAKLVVPYRAGENRFTLDEGGCFNDGGDIRVMVPREGVGRQTMLAALAVANSALGNFVYRYLGKPKGRVLEYFVRPLAAAPFGPPARGWSARDEAALATWLEREGPEVMARRVRKARRAEALITPALALLAARMLELHRDGRPEADAYAVDKAIDALVALLYGLTSKEESRVEKSIQVSRQGRAPRE